MSHAPSSLPPVDEWLSYCEHNKGFTPATVYNYRRALHHFFEWMKVAQVEVDDATPELLQRYAGEVLHARAQKPSTRRITVSALRGYYRWLKMRRQIDESPADHLPFPRKDRPLPLPIPADAVSKIMAVVDLQTFKGVRDIAMLTVLVSCGPRVSGVANLNEEDLIFTRNEKGMEELVLRLREKGRAERYVPAPEETRLMLRAYLGHPDLDRIDRRVSGGNVLFVNLNNTREPAHEHRGEARRISEWSIHQMIRGYGRRAKVEEQYLHPHAFRHLFGAELAEHETHLFYMKALLGHERSESSEVYSHVAFRKLREAAMKANPLKRIKHPAAGLAERLKAAMDRPA